MPISKKRNKKVKNNNLKNEFKNSANNLLERLTPKFPNSKIGTYKKSISGMLSEFAKPLIDESDDDEESIRSAINFSVLAWNIAVAIKKEGNNKSLENIFEMMAKDLSISEREMINHDIKKLVERKEHLFPDDNILIADVEISFKNGNIKLVAAAFINKD